MTAASSPNQTPHSPPSPAVAAVQRLALLQQLTQAAITAASERELHFIMLNTTAGLFAFDRATLWDVRGRPRALGVSGGTKINPNSETLAALKQVVASLPYAGNGETVTGATLGPAFAPGASVFWLPLPVDGQRGYGLCFERLAAPAWSEADAKAMRPVATVFSGALRLFARQRPWYRRVPNKTKRLTLAAALIAATLALVFVRLPLRIVAPCEVVATHPVPVNAPLDGVVREVRVRPGQEVTEGETLLVYDGDAVLDEAAVARKQVELVRSNLERVMALALENRDARSEARLLHNRLAQEEVRLEAALRRKERLVVTAPEAGTVIMGDPAELSGRPVRTGEALLLVANQAHNRLRIWLPQDDRIEFSDRHAVRVFLNADAGRSRRARLAYVAAHAQAGQDNVYGFMAEAEWQGGMDGIKLGLRGTAVLYGEDVALGYWLVRKPLAAVRRFLGV